MAKYTTLIFALFALVSCKETPPVPGNAHTPPDYKKSDLQKLRWIEGNWKSDVAGPGYYQSYHFPSDSVLEIVSYQFDGKDTSATELSRVYWRNNHLYMGPNGEWVGVFLTENALQLDPVRHNWHAIHWTHDAQKGEWTAVYKRPDFVRTIKMKRQAPLADLLKK